MNYKVIIGFMKRNGKWLILALAAILLAGKTLDLEWSHKSDKGEEIRLILKVN